MQPSSKPGRTDSTLVFTGCSATSAAPEAPQAGWQRREVTAGRTAADGNKIGIATVLGDVLLDPRQRPLHIHDVVRPGVPGTDAIGH